MATHPSTDHDQCCF